MARGPSRPGRRTARLGHGGRPPRLDRLSALVDRWAPPGGWIAAAFVLLTLSAAAGVVFPLSPAGIALQSLVGTGGAPLVPAWTGWLTWLLVRRQRPSAWRVVALVTLTLTWLLTLALRQPQGGGAIGETILSLLDAGFGRTSGLALVSVAASASVVNLVGIERILGWVAAVRLPHYALRVPRGALRSARARGVHLPTGAASEPVILGPRPLP